MADPSDETDNKKRRNLMFTSTAVLVAYYLGLKLPSVTLSGISASGEISAPPWKIWLLALMFLGYQAWRFGTDRATRELATNVASKYRSNLSQSTQSAYEKAIRAHLQHRRSLFIRVSAEPEVGFDDPDWHSASITIHVMDKAGQLHEVRPASNGDSSFGYAVSSQSTSRGSSSASGFQWEMSGIKIAQIHAIAALRTLVGFADCQDLAVPVCTVSAAIVVCVLMIFHSAEQVRPDSATLCVSADKNPHSWRA